jgi:hypothetical protein
MEHDPLSFGQLNPVCLQTRQGNIDSAGNSLGGPLGIFPYIDKGD